MKEQELVIDIHKR